MDKQSITPIVAWMPASVDACAYYRMFMPYLNISNSRYLFAFGPLPVDLLKGVNVVVVQRQVSDHNFVAMQKLKEMGLKVVYDLDDNIWNLPGFNPAKSVFSSNQDGFLKCARLADVLTVSTKGLATATKTGFKLNKEIVIVPNAMDFRLFKPKPIQSYDELTVLGWGGSNTHSVDCKDAFEAVCQVLDTNTNVVMNLVGAGATDSFIEKKMDTNGRQMQRKVVRASKLQEHRQTAFTPWVPIGEYPNRIASWGWDIALAPLDDNRFNKSKSNIKCLEAAAIKIPCLCSDVQPYNEFCSLGGPDLKWLLCNSVADWVKKLNILIHDEAMRKDLGNKMYDVAHRFFNLDTIKNNWERVFQQVLC